MTTTRCSLAALIIATAVVGLATGHPQVADPPTAVMTRAEFRARVGVACATPDLLPHAFRKLPIGFYKDYHSLGSAHHDADWAAGLDHVYLPTIQYISAGDTPEVRNMLRAAADSGQFPTPAGVEVEELIELLSLERLEQWLVDSTRSGVLPPGTVLMLGNEPGYRSNHDLRTPEMIIDDARILRDVLDRHDLPHRLALGGMATPDNAITRHAYGVSGMEFFESILTEAAAREIEFDAFIIHPYPCTGMDTVEAFETLPEVHVMVQDTVSQVRAFRALMNRFGHRDKDLIIGELGLPFAGGSDEAKVNAFAREILTWCLTATDEELGARTDDGHLVQRVTWFMLATPPGPTPGFESLRFNRSVLLDPEGDVTSLGQTLIELANFLAPE